MPGNTDHAFVVGKVRGSSGSQGAVTPLADVSSVLLFASETVLISRVLPEHLSTTTTINHDPGHPSGKLLSIVCMSTEHPLISYSAWRAG